MSRLLERKAPRAGGQIRFAGRQRQLAVVVLAALTGVRLVLAATTPLAPDEAYYWIWSRAPAAGYFDHPPMIALWIGAGTWLAGDSAFGVRLLGPLTAALASLLLWDAAERLVPGRDAGPAAVLLLNATVLVGVGAVLATPDSPLLFFWAAAVWALARLCRGGSLRWWLAAGLCIGLALASKYTAILLALGVGLWLVAIERAQLRRPGPYLGAAAAAAVFAPVLWWNATHNWASFLRQGGRTGAWHPDRAAQYLLELVLGQAALVTPLVFLLCVAGLALAAHGAWRRREPALALLAILGLLPAAVFIQHAIGDRVQANWPAIIYPSAAIAAAALGGRFWVRLRPPAIALGLAMTAIVYAAVFVPMPVPEARDPIALQLGGWSDLAASVEAARRNSGAGFVATDQYGLAAELARALPPGVPVLAIGPRWASFDLPPPAVEGMTGLLVQPEQHAAPVWPSSGEMGTVERRGRGGAVVARYRLYRVVPASVPSAVRLPHPGAE